MNPLTPQLRAAYSRSGLTIAQVGARAGVAERTVWAALNHRHVRTASLLRICAALDLFVLAVPPLPASSRVNPAA